MSKIKGATKVSITHRQRTVLHYYLRGMELESIARSVNVDQRTVRRDIEAIQTRLSTKIVSTDLYNLQRAFAELDEEWREAWILYDRQPQVIQTENGPVTMDDSFRKLAALDRIHRVIEEKARLCGFYSPKVMERITLVETTQGRGIQIERLTFDEQLKRGVEELENNEGLRRSEGLNPAD